MRKRGSRFARNFFTPAERPCSGGAPSGAAANQALIEQICACIAAELRAQGLSAEHCDYLEPHAFSVFSGITDQKLRALDIFAG